MRKVPVAVIETTADEEHGTTEKVDSTINELYDIVKSRGKNCIEIENRPKLMKIDSSQTSSSILQKKSMLPDTARKYIGRHHEQRKCIEKVRKCVANITLSKPGKYLTPSKLSREY